MSRRLPNDPQDRSMNKTSFFKPTLLASAAFAALATFAGCSGLPDDNAALLQARSDYAAAQADPATRELAARELKQAGESLDRANAAFAQRDGRTEVDHLAYLAEQRIAIARTTGRQKVAEKQVADADAVRAKARLAARTDEADAAQRDAAASQQQARSAQLQAQASQRDAEASQRDARAAQDQAADAQARNASLEAELKDMNAKQTDRGLVVTIGDVLFDTDRAQLRSGGERSVEKLAQFLKQYPQRTARVEGFTDSTGSEEHNQLLSGRRADAVRMAKVGLGVGADRISTHGYGEAFPVAGNDSAGGRQMNRRVEVILSDDNGRIAPR